jgi:hypothetical protein
VHRGSEGLGYCKSVVGVRPRHICLRPDWEAVIWGDSFTGPSGQPRAAMPASTLGLRFQALPCCKQCAVRYTHMHTRHERAHACTHTRTHTQPFDPATRFCTAASWASTRWWSWSSTRSWACCWTHRRACERRPGFVSCVLKSGSGPSQGLNAENAKGGLFCGGLFRARHFQDQRLDASPGCPGPATQQRTAAAAPPPRQHPTAPGGQ